MPLIGTEFALSPTQERLSNLEISDLQVYDLQVPDLQVSALPAPSGEMATPNPSYRDTYSNNHIDEDSMLLRGGDVPDAAEPQFQQDAPVALIPVNLESNTVRGGSVVVLGPQKSKDLSDILEHRVKMAQIKAAKVVSQAV
ncbi:unnamed protein product [Clonostachys rosea]|uniref:Uncharacterized protein n=1 Tax=Bionectria ochroleuca TaxID=29856 RepID=A0ABY6UBM9_BIOOC|nr:unnamed protein product [Clonostachys rosea]